MPLIDFSEGSVRPPSISDPNDPGAFIKMMNSPWYHLISELHEVILEVTVSYTASRGLKALFLPLTTRTVTCPSALGSDSAPVSVTVAGVNTYLADSMQFALEYGCRICRSGCYTIMPSFRMERPDSVHLIQFTHSEAEIVGDLEDLIRYVSGYVKTLAEAILNRLGDRLTAERGDISHLQRMVDRKEDFEQLTFEEAARVVGDVDGAILNEANGRSFTRKGELLLMKRVSEVVWVHHFDNLVTPFYQAFGDSDAFTAKNADMYFGMGEVVGAGERHENVEDLRKSMIMHDVKEADYEWYVRMREEAPMRTSGFGMGIDRFLMWVLRHNDIRDIPLISRLNEPESWPKTIVRP